MNVVVFAGDFGNQHGDTFGRAKDGPRMLGDLESDRAALQSCFDQHLAATNQVREHTQARTDLHTLAVDGVTTISRFAASSGVAGLAERFQLPRHFSDRELLSIGRAFVTKATEVADVLVARGMAPDTLTNLSAHLDALDQAITKQSAARETRTGLRAAINRHFTSAMTTIKAMDAVVKRGPDRDPQVIAGWKQRRRIGPSRANDTKDAKDAATAATAETPKPSSDNPRVA